MKIETFQFCLTFDFEELRKPNFEKLRKPNFEELRKPKVFEKVCYKTNFFLT